MWIMTTDGFYSTVAQQTKEGTLLVRARNDQDLARLEARLVDLGYPHRVIVRTPDADYPFRFEVSTAAWASYLEDATERITYTNFKGSVDRKHHDVYMRVWTALHALEPAGARPKMARGRRSL